MRQFRRVLSKASRSSICVVVIILLKLTGLFLAYISLHIYSQEKVQNMQSTASTITNANENWVSNMNDLLENAPVSYDVLRNKKKIKKTCGDFPRKFKENLDIVRGYKFNITEEYLRFLQLDEVGIQNLTSRTSSLSSAVILTAASSNHFQEVQGLIKSMHKDFMPLYPNISFVVFDIGLKEEELTLMKKYCQCQVRQFPFDRFPEHIRTLWGFGWKPIVIQMMLTEFDFVMWADASVRLKARSLHRIIEDTNKVGIQVLQGGGSIAERTNKRSFESLGERPCLFDFPELEATWITFRRSPFTLTAIMKPWVSCALQYGCMDFPESNKYLFCPSRRHFTIFSFCHRYDQSILGILLTRLFNHKIQLCIFNGGDIGKVRKGQRVRYFPQPFAG